MCVPLDAGAALDVTRMTSWQRSSLFAHCFQTMVQPVAGDYGKLRWHFTPRRSPVCSLLLLLLLLFLFVFLFLLFIFFFFGWGEYPKPSYACQVDVLLIRLIGVCPCTRCRCGQLKLIKLSIFKIGTLVELSEGLQIQNWALNCYMFLFTWASAPSKGFVTIRDVPKLLRKWYRKSFKIPGDLFEFFRLKWILI